MPFYLVRPTAGWTAHPLDDLTVIVPVNATIVVRDGAGREYVRQVADSCEITFCVGGALGEQVIEVVGGPCLTFPVDAHSGVHDHEGRFSELFELCVRSMRCYSSTGIESVTWRGRTYRYFVPWMLDHVHTAKGMRWISPITNELVDLMSENQRADGMIWSFAFPVKNGIPGYHWWAYKDQGYARVDGDVLFGRQPVENHCEYNFVDCLHLAWQSSGDLGWMRSRVENAIRALDYTVGSDARWSKRFQLLKRGCTIDSWDFQAEDTYLVQFPMGSDQQIDPQRTKFVIFFGDNTGYCDACDKLARLLDVLGRTAEANRFRERSAGIRARLQALTWNGRFYRHHVEEEDGIDRNLGIDEATQIVMSNAYTLNRGCDLSTGRAILATYQELRKQAPPRSPGEWYAIFPPYPRFVGGDRWQYMNGGVHGHAAGELARGAFRFGYEHYGVDQLQRLLELGKRHGGLLRFCWTGGFDAPPPAPVYTPIDLTASVTMDIAQGTRDVPSWMEEGPHNDLATLPTGNQEFAGIPWQITDPGANGRRVVVGVGGKRLPREVRIPIGRMTIALNLLHTANAIGPSGTAGILRFQYDDGTEKVLCLQNGKHIAGWWFPELKTSDSGVAWRGANTACGDVGIHWCAVANPCPEKRIDYLIVSGGSDGSLYGLIALTLADRMPFHEPSEVSTGGPDNWAGGLVLAALMEGLAGIDDHQDAYRHVTISPRWTAAETSAVAVTARYAACQGYVSYRFRHQPDTHTIHIELTGSGEKATLRLLLPPGATTADQGTIEVIGSSVYLVTSLPLDRVHCLSIHYA